MPKTFNPSRPRGLPRPHTCLFADTLVESVADGGDVTAWASVGTASVTASQASTSPARLDHDALNGRAGVYIGADQALATGAVSISRPLTYVMVISGHGSTSSYLFDGVGSSARAAVYGNTSTTWQYFAGGPGASTAQPALDAPAIVVVRDKVDLGNTLAVNNGTPAQDGSAGTQLPTSGWTIGARYSLNGQLSAHVCLFMVFETDLLVDYPDEWQRFLAEIASYYSIPSYSAPAQDDQRRNGLAYHPGAYGPLAAWYDGKDESSFTFDSGDGVSVATWGDKGPNGWDLTAYSTFPQRQSDGWVLFNGTDNALRSALAVNNLADTGDSKTLFVVCAYTSDVGNAGIYGKTVAATTDGRWGLFEGAGKLGVKLDVGDVADASLASMTSTALIIHEATLVRGSPNADLSYWQNGALNVTGAKADAGATYNLNHRVWLGAYGAADGSTPFAGYFFPGHICEVVDYGEALDADMRANVRVLLADKWGVTL